MLFKWYQEPFLHFIILGAILFFIVGGDGSSDSDDKGSIIVVKQKDISKVLNYWSREHNTTPTSRELEMLLKEYKQDEILYREALKRGLYKDDLRIKKILVDKLKYTLSDSLNINELSTDILKEYFKTHKEQFADETSTFLTFGQIYISPKKHDNIELVAKNLLKKVNGSSYTESLAKEGDKFYAGNYFNNLSKQELLRYFSNRFLNELIKLPKSRWSVLKSGYGIHLIYMVDITKEVTFNSVKERVKDRYLIEKNHNAYKKFYEEIKDEYKIKIENSSSKDGIE